MGTTAGGLPYPEPTDPVANGAAAIRALAEAVDPSGMVAYSELTVASNGYGTTEQTIQNLSFNGLVLSPARIYRITTQFRYQVTVGNRLIARIKWGTTGLNLADLNIPNAISYPNVLLEAVLRNPAGAPNTLAVTLQVVTGAGPAQVMGAVDSPAFVLLQDIT